MIPQNEINQNKLEVSNLEPNNPSYYREGINVFILIAFFHDLLQKKQKIWEATLELKKKYSVLTGAISYSVLVDLDDLKEIDNSSRKEYSELRKTINCLAQVNKTFYAVVCDLLKPRAEDNIKQLALGTAENTINLDFIDNNFKLFFLWTWFSMDCFKYPASERIKKWTHNELGKIRESLITKRKEIIKSDSNHLQISELHNELKKQPNRLRAEHSLNYDCIFTWIKFILMLAIIAGAIGATTYFYQYANAAIGDNEKKMRTINQQLESEYELNCHRIGSQCELICDDYENNNTTINTLIARYDNLCEDQNLLEFAMVAVIIVLWCGCYGCMTWACVSKSFTNLMENLFHSVQMPNSLNKMSASFKESVSGFVRKFGRNIIESDIEMQSAIRLLDPNNLENTTETAEQGLLILSENTTLQDSKETQEITHLIKSVDKLKKKVDTSKVDTSEEHKYYNRYEQTFFEYKRIAILRNTEIASFKQIIQQKYNL